MAVVRPLEALRYDPARAGDVGSLLAPPYDVITPSEQAELHARSPYNVIRLILSQEADRAAAAARTLRDWVERGILVRDRMPAVYLYSQRFSLPDGTTRRRDGLLCRLRLEEYARGIVRRHERTLAAPKVERLAVLRATGMGLDDVVKLTCFMVDATDYPAYELPLDMWSSNPSVADAPRRLALVASPTGGRALVRTGIAIALPELSAAERVWRLHFTAGAMAHTVTRAPILRDVFGGELDLDDRRLLIARLVRKIEAWRTPRRSGGKTIPIASWYKASDSVWCLARKRIRGCRA